MKYSIHRAAGRKTINWASGTSTEIFIHPSSGDFVTRDFTFRISTATVEAEESSFTFFEGITRHLMILKGNLELIHEGRYTKHLAPYDQDTFSGEWATKSKGKVTDFNLMLKHGATGKLEVLTLKPQAHIEFHSKATNSFLYISEGQVHLDQHEIHTGDLIQCLGDSIQLTAVEATKIIAIEVIL